MWLPLSAIDYWCVWRGARAGFERRIEERIGSSSGTAQQEGCEQIWFDIGCFGRPNGLEPSFQDVNFSRVYPAEAGAVGSELLKLGTPF